MGSAYRPAATSEEEEDLNTLEMTPYRDDMKVPIDDDEYDDEMYLPTDSSSGRPGRCFKAVCCAFSFVSIVVAAMLIGKSRSSYSHTNVRGFNNQAETEDKFFTSPSNTTLYDKLKAFHDMKHPTPKQDFEVSTEIQQWLDTTVSLNDGVKYEIVKQMTHDTSSFTEGLTYFDGKLWESVGLNGQSAVLELDPETGKTVKTVHMTGSYFGEGLTYVEGRLVQLTYKKKTGFVYNASDLQKKPETFKFSTETGEGWGMTYDHKRNEIVVSDGSQYLFFWDPETFEEKRRVPVTLLNGNAANQINELEYWRDRIIANIWYRDIIIVINPETGYVEKEYDFTELWPKAERNKQRANVLNGISVSEDPDLLYITGKKWDRMFLIRLNA